MNEFKYSSPSGGWIMRQMWRAAGADRMILEQSTYSDQVKYMCLGGIIVATGVMAGIAGGYAFYTIFSARGSSIENQFQPTVMTISVFFGLLWGMMIFNLDRFIVSSTGKGDGTEVITWEEIKGAFPRLIMGAIIALTISKPVEIRMFKSEIDAALHEEQLILRKDYEKRTRANYQDRLKLVDADIKKIEDERANMQSRIEKAEKELTDQLQGRAGAPAGDGRLSDALRQQKTEVEAKLKEFDSRNSTRVNELLVNKRTLLKEMDDELRKNVTIANGLDGLLERIKLAHKIAGFWISLFITLLFMAIELTPIFFKLMLVKSPYDFLKENVEEMIKAQHGIYSRIGYYNDNGEMRDLTVHLSSDKQILEQRELHRSQKRLTKYAIAKYEEQMKKLIDEDPGRFVSNDLDISTLDSRN